MADDGADIFYVAESELEAIKKKIADGKEVTEDVDKLTFPENLPADAMMVPVDMRGVESQYEDVEEMKEKLGPKGAAESFIKAREYFEKNKGDDPAQPMTAEEWQQVLEEDALGFEGEEEEFPFEGEEEELLEEPEEEEGNGEPAAKKA